MEVQLNIEQIKVLTDFFNDLSDVDQRKVFMKGYRKAAEPLIKAAKAKTPVMKAFGSGHTLRTSSAKPEETRRSIGAVFLPESVSVLIGARMTGVDKGWVYPWLEDGTKERFRKQTRLIKRGYFKGQTRGVSGGTGSTGRMIGKQYFENAYNETESQVFDDIDNAWIYEIDDIIRKTNSKIRK